MSGAVRAFLSVDIDDDALISRIVHIQQKLDRQSAKLKIVEPNNLHFTLRFFGDTPHAKIDQIQHELEKTEFSPFTIRIEGVGAFPSNRRPNVIWVGVTQNVERFVRLKLSLDDLLGNLGYPADRRFHAHITIARVRSIRDRDRILKNLDSLTAESVGTMSVDCFRLTRSTLTQAGPIYETIWEMGAR
ncbi:MAG: RNA 2',3'-cyclic phosphodiesterase [Candidatus Thorarchaeota archaeon]|jgi:2'-5' RNA ligase